MQLQNGAWVVVADGEKYLVLGNEGVGRKIDLRVLAVEKTRSVRTGEIGTDRPGRYPIAGGRMTTVEQTDWKTLGKEEFVAALADRLDREATANKVTSIVTMADARTLGVLRQRLKPNIRKIVTHEIVGDYAHNTLERIEAALRSA